MRSRIATDFAFAQERGPQAGHFSQRVEVGVDSPAHFGRGIAVAGFFNEFRGLEFFQPLVQHSRRDAFALLLQFAEG